MFTKEFLIDPLNTQNPKLCKITLNKSTVRVEVEKADLGALVRDPNSEYGFYAINEGLTPLLKTITENMGQIGELIDFAERLDNSFGQNITQSFFFSEENLLLVVNPEIDFEEFVSALRDTVNDYVTFKGFFAVFLLQGSPLKQALIKINE